MSGTGVLLLLPFVWAVCLECANVSVGKDWSLGTVVLGQGWREAEVEIGALGGSRFFRECLTASFLNNEMDGDYISCGRVVKLLSVADELSVGRWASPSRLKKMKRRAVLKAFGSVEAFEEERALAKGFRLDLPEGMSPATLAAAARMGRVYYRDAHHVVSTLQELKEVAEGFATLRFGREVSVGVKYREGCRTQWISAETMFSVNLVAAATEGKILGNARSLLGEREEDSDRELWNSLGKIRGAREIVETLSVETLRGFEMLESGRLAVWEEDFHGRTKLVAGSVQSSAGRILNYLELLDRERTARIPLVWIRVDSRCQEGTKEDVARLLGMLRCADAVGIECTPSDQEQCSPKPGHGGDVLDAVLEEIERNGEIRGLVFGEYSMITTERIRRIRALPLKTIGFVSAIDISDHHVIFEVLEPCSVLAGTVTTLITPTLLLCPSFSLSTGLAKLETVELVGSRSCAEIPFSWKRAERPGQKIKTLRARKNGYLEGGGKTAPAEEVGASAFLRSYEVVDPEAVDIEIPGLAYYFVTHASKLAVIRPLKTLALSLVFNGYRVPAETFRRMVANAAMVHGSDLLIRLYPSVTKEGIGSGRENAHLCREEREMFFGFFRDLFLRPRRVKRAVLRLVLAGRHYRKIELQSEEILAHFKKEVASLGPREQTEFVSAVQNCVQRKA